MRRLRVEEEEKEEEEEEEEITRTHAFERTLVPVATKCSITEQFKHCDVKFPLYI